jgi:hypothetical protein
MPRRYSYTNRYNLKGTSFLTSLLNLWQYMM